MIRSILVLFGVLGLASAQAQDELPYRFPVPEPENELTHPYDARVDASALLDLTFARARVRNVPSLLIFDANWCHDSQGLARRLAEEDALARMVRDHYELAFINVGVRTENQDLVRLLGVPSVIGTPTLIIVSPEGEVLNRDTVDDWRATNRAATSDIASYLARYSSAEPGYETSDVLAVDMDAVAFDWPPLQDAVDQVEAALIAGEMTSEEAEEIGRYATGMARSIVRHATGRQAENFEEPVAMMDDLEALGIAPSEDISNAVLERMNAIEMDILTRRLIDMDQTTRAIAGEVGYPDGYNPPGSSSSDDDHD